MIDDDDACCISGETRECGPSTEQGICTRGQVLCDNGVWGICSGAVWPGAEVCDGVDNDCDGQVDDGCASGDCPEGPIPLEGCICGSDIRTSGSCCNGLWYESGCPFPWVYLIYIGVMILVVLFIIVMYLGNKGKELTFEMLLKRKYR